MTQGVHVHVRECDTPRWLRRRFEHRPWVCACGQAWTTYWAGAGDGGAWLWKKWNP